MNKDEFIEKLYNAYINSDGDLWAFWAAMNPDKPRDERTTRERVVFLYCNKRSKTDGTEWIKRCGKVDGIVFDFDFRTATVPKYHGHIKLLDYVLLESEKKIIVYKYDFITSTQKNSSQSIDN